MDELLRKIEILERCAAECLLIARLAINPDAQAEGEELASEYQAIVDRLRNSDLLPPLKLDRPAENSLTGKVSLRGAPSPHLGLVPRGTSSGLQFHRDVACCERKSHA